MTKATTFSAAVFAMAGLMAQSGAAETLTDADCKAVWEGASLLTSSFETKVVEKISASGGWCQLDGVTLSSTIPYSPRFHLARLSFRGDGLAGLFDLSTPPGSIEMKIEDLVISVTIADPVMSYLIAAQAGARGIDADLSAEWDASAKRLSLNHLKLDFPGDNEITAAATLQNVDLSSPGAAQASLPAFSVTSFEGSILSNGLFENYGLVPLGNLLLGAEMNPGARVDALKAQATAAIAVLPEARFSAATRAALTAVVAQMPNPAGQLKFAVTSEPGLGLQQLSGLLAQDGPQALAGLAAALAPVAGNATFVPTAAE